MKRLDLMSIIGFKIGREVKLSSFIDNKILYIENLNHMQKTIELKKIQQDLRVQDQYTKINYISI